MAHRSVWLTLALALPVVGCGSLPAAPAASLASTTVAAADLAAESEIKTDKAIMYKTIDILGIGPVYASALQKAKVRTVMDLLDAGHTRGGRERLAAMTGISTKLLLTWVNHCDLMRMTRTGPVYARLLEEAGVDTVAEMARRDAVRLRPALEKAHLKGGYSISDRLPSIATLNVWISRARDLGRFVEY